MSVKRAHTHHTAPEKEDEWKSRRGLIHPSSTPRVHISVPCAHRFAAEFDFRTFDPEGVILYAESSQDAWFMLGLRGGRIEVQFKNQHSVKVTSGGKAINDGQWHVVRVEAQWS